MAKEIVNKHIILGFIYEITHEKYLKIRKNENFEKKKQNILGPWLKLSTYRDCEQRMTMIKVSDNGGWEKREQTDKQTDNIKVVLV